MREFTVDHTRDEVTSENRHRMLVAPYARTAAFHTAVDYFYRTIGYAKLRDFLFPAPLRRALSWGPFPNNLGNYRGKRTPRPIGEPLSPRERLARLQAHYLSCAQTYRNPPTPRDCVPSAAETRRSLTVHRLRTRAAHAA